MTRLFPRETERADTSVEGNPAGHRIFRVTDRTIQERTQLVIADTPESAIAQDATAIDQVGRQTIHEVVECVELVPTSTAYHAPPEVVPS